MGPVDIVFLVDSSVSIGKDNFSKQLDFIKEFVKSVYISQTFNRVSVITFSFNARLEFNFTKYLENKTLLDAIDQIQYSPGVTNTGSALRAAREEVFPSNRTNVTKRVIILTDSMSSNKSDTRMQAKLLKDAGVTIVAIGIGSKVLHEELLEMASDYSDVYTISTFDGLYSIQHKIGRCVYQDTLTLDFCQSSERLVWLHTLERRMIEWNGINLYSSSPTECIVTLHHLNTSSTHEDRICFYVANFTGKLGTYIQLFISKWYSKHEYKEKIFTNNVTYPSEYCYNQVPAGFLLYTTDNETSNGYLRIYVTIETIKKNQVSEDVMAKYIPYIVGGVIVFVLVMLYACRDEIGECWGDLLLIFCCPLWILLLPCYGIYKCCKYCRKKSPRVPGESQENGDVAGYLGCCRYRSASQQQTPPEIEISAISVISNQVLTSSLAVADAETGTSSSDEQSELPFNPSLRSVMSVELASDEVRDDITKCPRFCTDLFQKYKITTTGNNET